MYQEKIKERRERLSKKKKQQIFVSLKNRIFSLLKIIFAIYVTGMLFPQSDSAKKMILEIDAQMDLKNYTNDREPQKIIRYVSDFEYKERKQLIEELKLQIKSIFGSDWKTAYAIAEAECNSRRTDWPKCKLSWEKEHSIGWFQINIAEKEGYGKKIHWNKIPGSSLEQKEAWLSDPFNNVLMAKVIMEQADGFTPWTAYTSGNYIVQLEKIN